MSERMRTIVRLGIFLGVALSLAVVLPCAAQSGSPVIYYQGRLTLAGEPANGWYDFEFRLYDEVTGGKQITPAQAAGDIYVDGGMFALFLSFGDVADDTACYLEASVRPGGSGEPFTTLSPREPVNPILPSDVVGQQTTDETWRLGVTVEGERTYTSVIGRLAGEAANLRSNYGVTDIYFVFPAPATQKTVQSARFYITSRTGSYADAARMTLEVIDFGGFVQHIVSQASVDMQVAATGTWTPVSISGSPENVISPGEYLAFHFQLSADPGGDLDVRPIFEVDVN